MVTHKCGPGLLLRAGLGIQVCGKRPEYLEKRRTFRKKSPVYLEKRPVHLNRTPIDFKSCDRICV